MTEKKFEALKYGDKVRVKKRLKLDDVYGGICFSSYMRVYLGETLTIHMLATIGRYTRYARCHENEFAYTRDMIEIPFKFGR